MNHKNETKAGITHPWFVSEDSHCFMRDRML